MTKERCAPGSFQDITSSNKISMKTSVAPRHEFWGPKSMEIYRWRFKNLSKLCILVRTFICVKLVICMFLLNRYHHKLIDNSYSNVKIVQNLMII